MVLQHVGVDAASQGTHRRSVSRHRLEVQEQRPDPRQVGVRAFVEWAALVRHAAGNQPPCAVEVLEAHERLEPAQVTVGGVPLAGKV